MIVFNTGHYKLFNYIVHHFLEVEVFNEVVDVGDMIEIMIPKYLFREQYHKCKKVFEDLYRWTEDAFYHEMSCFHELALYHFIDYMADLRNEIDDFDVEYFDNKCRSLIEESSKLEYNEDPEIPQEDLKEMYYDVLYYTEFLFTDTDFLLIETLYNNRHSGNTNLEEYLGINIDFYFDILPLDIQDKYKTKHITLTGEISEMLNYITHRINHGNLYKLFWENDNPVNEDRIQLILENIMDAYYYNQEIDITRESLLGNGKVDFKIYKNKYEEEKVLIEIKKANSSYLKKGYEKQLTDYMLSSNYTNAFYLIVCFTDNDYERTTRFISDHIYTDSIQLYINISILDLRKRKTASVS